MRSLLRARTSRIRLAAVAATLLVVASATTTVAGKPQPAPLGTVAVAIAAAGTLEPSRQYAVVDVTVTCTTGWTVTQASLYLRQSDPGGAGSFATTCTGAPQVVRARAVNGNKWTLGNATATAYVTISRNGQNIQTSSQRTIRLEPGVVVRVADQGQLASGDGTAVRLAVAVACPAGAAGQASTLGVSQGAASGQGSFTPTCDGTSRTQVISITASQGTFQTGAAVGTAAATVAWNSGTFGGSDSRSIAILESSTGDTTPPSIPLNLSANVFGDGETWLSWSASTDNATSSGLIVYEVFLNGRFDQSISGGYTQAILYADRGIMNTVEVVAIDGAGNRSGPASVPVDCTNGWCQ